MRGFRYNLPPGYNLNYPDLFAGEDTLAEARKGLKTLLETYTKGISIQDVREFAINCLKYRDGLDRLKKEFSKKQPEQYKKVRSAIGLMEIYAAFLLERALYKEEELTPTLEQLKKQQEKEIKGMRKRWA